MKLSIIIPVYNEKDTLLEVLKQIDEVDIPLEKEIIVLDGCSTDGTREILRKLQYKNTRVIFEEGRLGKGFAVRRGFREATGNILLIQDADLELNPKEYPKLLKPIIDGNCKVVYGSRFLRGRGLTNWGSYIGNRVVTAAINMFFFSNLTDFGTAYKVFCSSVIRDLSLCCNSFDFDAEITAKILKKGYHIKEVSVCYTPRDKKHGKKLHWLVGFRVLLSVIWCRFVKDGSL